MGNTENINSEHMINSLSRASLPCGRCLSSQGGVDHSGPVQCTEHDKPLRKLARNEYSDTQHSSVKSCWKRNSQLTMEKEMATHSSVLAWRIPGTGEPGGLPSLGSHRVGHD